MSVNREEIVVSVGMDNSKIRAGMNGLKEMGNDIVHHFTSLFLTGELLHGVENLSSSIHQMKNEASNLGVSTDFFQGFRKAANELGPGFEKANAALIKLSANLGEAKSGDKGAIGKFTAMGISLAQIQSMNTEEMFMAVADAVKGIPDPAKRSAVALELMGRSGSKMAGMLAQGSEEIENVIKHAGKLSESEIKEIDKLHETIEVSQGKLKIWSAKLIYAIGDVAKNLGYLSTGNYFGGLEQEWSDQARVAEAAEREKAEAVKASEESIREQFRKTTEDAARNADEQYRIAANKGRATAQELALRQQGFGKNSPEMANMRVIEEKQKILELENAIAAAAGDEAKQQELTNQLNAAKIQLLNLEDDYLKKKNNQNAGAPLNTAANGNPILQEYLTLRARIASGRMSNQDMQIYGQRAREDYNKLSLEDRLRAMSPENLPDQMKHSKESADALKELLRIAVNQGLKVQLPTDDNS